LNENFGTYLKKLRTQSGLSQKEVAAQLGVSSMAISQYEAGRAYPPKKYLPTIAKLYEVSVNRLKFRMLQDEYEIQSNVDIIDLQRELQEFLKGVSPPLEEPVLKFIDPAYQELNDLLEERCGQVFRKEFPTMCAKDKQRFAYGVSVAWATIAGPEW
jgi:transcriptional regulator with XRE-family HTH domain